MGFETIQSDQESTERLQEVALDLRWELEKLIEEYHVKRKEKELLQNEEARLYQCIAKSQKKELELRKIVTYVREENEFNRQNILKKIEELDLTQIIAERIKEQKIHMERTVMLLCSGDGYSSDESDEEQKGKQDTLKRKPVERGLLRRSTVSDMSSCYKQNESWVKADRSFSTERSIVQQNEADDDLNKGTIFNKIVHSGYQSSLHVLKNWFEPRNNKNKITHDEETNANEIISDTRYEKTYEKTKNILSENHYTSAVRRNSYKAISHLLIMPSQQMQKETKLLCDDDKKSAENKIFQDTQHKVTRDLPHKNCNVTMMTGIENENYNARRAISNKSTVDGTNQTRDKDIINNSVRSAVQSPISERNFSTNNNVLIIESDRDNRLSHNMNPTVPRNNQIKPQLHEDELSCTNAAVTVVESEKSLTDKMGSNPSSDDEIKHLSVGRIHSTKRSEQAGNESISDMNHVVKTVKIEPDNSLSNNISPIPSTNNQTDSDSIETSDTIPRNNQMKPQCHKDNLLCTRDNPVRQYGGTNDVSDDIPNSAVVTVVERESEKSLTNEMGSNPSSDDEIKPLSVERIHSTKRSEQAGNESISETNHVMNVVEIEPDNSLSNNISPIPSTNNQSISTSDTESIETSDTEPDSRDRNVQASNPSLLTKNSSQEVETLKSNQLHNPIDRNHVVMGKWRLAFESLRNNLYTEVDE